MRRVFTGYFCWLFLLIFFCSGQAFSENQVSSESELQKRADHYFAAENYEAALTDYSRLLSLYPQEAIYNYRFGVCLLIAGKEKSNASTYLENASKDLKTPKDVWFYLGKSYMVNGNFVKAKESFEKFKKVANASDLKKYNVDAFIQNCESGNTLIKQRKNVVVQSSNEVALNAFYSNYDFSSSAGKVVKAAPQFLSILDQGKEKDPVMYISDDKQKVLVASFGRKGETGKDIYIIRKTPDNQWSPPENIGPAINTSADEDFPFLARDGRTLYFSSRGHNSIGGYDIFKSVFDFNTNKWMEPENLGIPINTVGDDFLFVPDEKGSGATYATNVESSKNFVAIRKVQIPGGFNEMLTISGTYIPLDQKVRRDARISILTGSGDGIITTVHTDPVTGKYELVLEPGQNYMIVVEGGGYLPHSEVFDLPSGMTNPELRQVVKINKDSQKEELTLQNYFSSGATASEPSKTISQSFPTNVDVSALMSVKINDQVVYVTPPSTAKNESLVSKKDSLSASVNPAGNSSEKADSNALPTITIKKRDKYDPSLVQGQSQGEIHQEEEEAERQKEINEEDSNPEKSYDLNISNEELANLAYDDAKAMKEEADSLNKEVADIRKNATEKQNLAVALKSKAETPGLNADSAASLLEQSEMNRLEAKEMNKRADDISAVASSRDAEATTAMKDADEIFKTSKTSGAVTANAKKSGSKSPSKNQSVTTKTKPTDSNASAKESLKVQPEKAVVADEIVYNKQPEADNSSAKNEKADSLASSQNKIVATPPVPVYNSGDETTQIINEDYNPMVESDNSCDDHVPIKTYDHLTQPVTQSAVNSQAKSNSDSLTIASTQNLSKNNAASEQNKKIAEANLPVQQTENKTSEPSAAKKDSAITHNNTVNDKPSAVSSASVDTSISTGNNQLNTKDNEKAALKTEAKVPTAEDKNSAKKNTVEDKNTAPSITVTPDGQAVMNLNIASKEIKADSTASNAKGLKSKNGTTTRQSSGNNSGEIALAKSSVPENSNSKNDIGKLNSNSKSGNNSGTEKKAPEITLEKQKPLVGEGPKNEKANAVDEIDPKDLPQPVKEEARIAYREYQRKMEHSNQLTAQSIQLQDVISHTYSSPKRDSMIRVSNDMTLQSMQEWQEALKQIQEARKYEPNIEYKMGVNDYAANNRKAQQNKTDLTTNNSDTINTSPANLAAASKSPVTNPEANAGTSPSSSFANKAEVSKSPVTNPEANALNSKSSTKNNKTANLENATATKSVGKVTVHNSPETESIANIDTTNVEYPTYVRLKKEITDKQVETIDVFAEAVNLNKKSLEEKDSEGALMDQAQTEKDSAKKAELIRKSFEFKALSEKHAAESKHKFELAQQNTSAVKGLRGELSSVIDRISRKPAVNDELASTGTKPVKGKSVNPETKSEVKKSPEATSTENKKPVNGSNERQGEIFAKAETNDAELNASEEDISSVDVSKNSIKDFERNIFGKVSASPYSEKNPIPMDPGLPEGLVFKVQIGAFHKPLPSDIFKGLQPLSGETTRPGWIRYCVGLFKTFEPANIAKKEVQRSGYKDAFVVAYYNGKRIELNEAYRMARQKENLTAYKKESAKEIAMLRAINIRPEQASPLSNDNDERSFYGKPKLPANTSTSTTGSVEYAVQVGVYRTTKAPSVLASLQPLTSEEINPNLFRFTYGRYPDRQAAESAKAQAIQAGVPDAFIVVYRSGNKAEVSEVAAVTVKETPVADKKAPAVTENKTAAAPVVTKSGLIYKVQIGAYKNDVPYNVIEAYLQITDKGITRETDERNLHIFYAGSDFTTFKAAEDLRNEIAAKGVKDAFVVALSDGKRIAITDDMKAK